MSADERRQLAELERPFRVIAFDWDGTAVSGRKEDASAVCALLERLLRASVFVVVITGTNLANTVAQLGPLIRDAGSHNRRLFIATNRGSEVYGFDGRTRPLPLFRRTATPEVERQLSAAAEDLRDELVRRTSLPVKIVYDRLNRRKVDLIPLPEWADPPKSRIGELLEAVQSRLFCAGIHGGLQEVLRLAEAASARAGLADARVTSDVKHVEIGLTDKSDSIEWMLREVCDKNGVDLRQVLIAGDEFGPVGGVEGSDHKMLTPRSRGATFVTVGPEPGGVEPQILSLGGGPARFRELLEAQADLHEGKRRVALEGKLPLPLFEEDPRWMLSQPGADLARERELESVFSVGNGYFGTRGALAERAQRTSSPATFIAGVFDALPESRAVPELAVAPDWTRLRLLVEGRPLSLEEGECLEHRRVLDLKQGAVWREWRHRDPAGRVTRMRGFRLASLADRHLALQALEVVPENWSGKLLVELAIEPASGVVAGMPVTRPRMIPASSAPVEGTSLFHTTGSGMVLALASQAEVRGPSRAVAAEATVQDGARVERFACEVKLGETWRVERIASLFTSRDGTQPERQAASELGRAAEAGTAALAAAHSRAWRQRWDECAVEIEGDPQAERALRFAAYHLIAAANPEDERVSIGARTLTGESYKGHVFWDTDVFVLPFLVYTWPAAARALLMYRFHGLDGARRKAAQGGWRGALYPWESADTGDETTPRFMLAHGGEMIPILSGIQEHHISADVAWAAWAYYQATRDQQFLLDAGAEILFETARFWTSRAEQGADGRFHIRKVIGPDEYHEGVDDDAFTNGMAQLNTEVASEVHRLLRERWPGPLRALEERLGLDAAEVEGWQKAAAGLEVPPDPGSGLIEQCQGFFAMEDYDLGPMRAQGKRAAPMDMLLGRERTLRAQIVKQADVVMLLQLRWERFSPRVREANFRYYEPRTCHGSSLSPATHSLVAARLGDLPMALEYFRQAAEIDLGNSMGNAAGGVHAAALGGLWQAAVFGFGGVAAEGGELRVAPRVPESWRSLRFPLRFAGARLEVHATPRRAAVRLRDGPPVTVAVGAGPARRLAPGEEISAEL